MDTNNLANHLHAKIMNIPPMVGRSIFASWTRSEQNAYHLGHRDARHAAAELVSAHTQPPATVPAKRFIPPRDQALCNDGSEPDWAAYAAEETQPPAGELPVLPLPTKRYEFTLAKEGWFTADQMLEYGRLCATRQPAPVADVDREARNKVARAIGMHPGNKFSFAWEYLIGMIEELAKDDGVEATYQQGRVDTVREALQMLYDDRDVIEVITAKQAAQVATALAQRVVSEAVPDGECQKCKGSRVPGEVRGVRCTACNGTQCVTPPAAPVALSDADIRNRISNAIYGYGCMLEDHAGVVDAIAKDLATATQPTGSSNEHT